MLMRPFNGLYYGFLALIVGTILLIRYGLRNRTERQKAAFLVALSLCNLVFYFLYKAQLSVDAEFVRISGIAEFNWFNELPLQLCNINLFLIPLGVLTKKRPILGFAFFAAPLGAAMALLCPEPAFSGYSILLPRMLGFYGTHALLVICGISLATLGFYRPQPKDLPGICKTVLILVGCAHLLNMVLRHTVCPWANYFFTYPADVGILRFFWHLIPVPLLYLLPAVGILLGYMGLVSMLFQSADRARARRAAREDLCA